MLKRIRNKLRHIVNTKELRNNELRKIAALFRNELIIKATSAELKFIGILDSLHIDVEFQYIIYIESNKRIKKFYIVDFCDIRNRIIFEIDGWYHNDLKQQERDSIRTRNLTRLGYRIYRFTNELVFNNIPVPFLRSLYKRY